MATTRIKFRLQGHEKFSLREGWINKGLLVVPNNPDVFLRNDASDVFGIGTNMVKSLRYWMKALGLMTEKSGSGASLTKIGELIAKYDPYIEHSFTLWLMHSNIVKNVEEATTWNMYFNRCDANNIDKDQISSILFREITKYVNGTAFSRKSLDNDIDVLINMYGKNKEAGDPEDKYSSPFATLGLLTNVNGVISKKSPDRRFISEQLVLFELANSIDNAESISIEDFILGENGLRNTYHLPTVVCNEFLDKLDAAGYIRVDRTAGLDMIYPMMELVPEEIIEKYYSKC